MTTPLPAASTRQQLIALLVGEQETIKPGVYDRLEAWWYGAAANSRRAFAADIRAWRAFCMSAGVAMVPASALIVRDFVRARHRDGAKASSIAANSPALPSCTISAAMPPPPPATASSSAK